MQNQVCIRAAIPGDGMEGLGDRGLQELGGAGWDVCEEDEEVLK